MTSPVSVAIFLALVAAFDMDVAQGKEYKIYTSEKLKWDQAYSSCNKQPNWHLLVIDTEQEHNQVVELLKKARNLDDGEVWVALAKTDQKYEWIHPAMGVMEPKYTNWGAGELEKQTEDSSYCVSISREKDWKWAANSCGDIKYYVCERI